MKPSCFNISHILSSNPSSPREKDVALEPLAYVPRKANHPSTQYKPLNLDIPSYSASFTFIDIAFLLCLPVSLTSLSPTDSLFALTKESLTPSSHTLKYLFEDTSIYLPPEVTTTYCEMLPRVALSLISSTFSNLLVPQSYTLASISFPFLFKSLMSLTNLPRLHTLYLPFTIASTQALVSIPPTIGFSIATPICVSASSTIGLSVNFSKCFSI